MVLNWEKLFGSMRPNGNARESQESKPPARDPAVDPRDAEIAHLKRERAGLIAQCQQYQQQILAYHQRDQAEAFASSAYAEQQRQAQYHYYARANGANAWNTYQWQQALGFTTWPTLQEIESRFRELAKTAHPDHGGTSEAFTRLTQARDEGRKAVATRVPA